MKEKNPEVEVDLDIETLNSATIRTIRAIRQDTSPITDYRRKHSRDRKSISLFSV